MTEALVLWRIQVMLDGIQECYLQEAWYCSTGPWVWE